MRTISRATKRTRRLKGIPPLPRIDPKTPELTGKKLLRWLKDQGAEPIDAATKKRLIASGNWGMPNE